MTVFIKCLWFVILKWPKTFYKLRVSKTHNLSEKLRRKVLCCILVSGKLSNSSIHHSYQPGSPDLFSVFSSLPFHRLSLFRWKISCKGCHKLHPLVMRKLYSRWNSVGAGRKSYSVKETQYDWKTNSQSCKSNKYFLLLFGENMMFCFFGLDILLKYFQNLPLQTVTWSYICIYDIWKCY